MARSKKPAFSNVISRFTTNQILYGLLLIAVFLVGYLFARVQSLEGGQGSTAGANTGNTVAAANPQPSQPPTNVNVGVGHLPLLGDKNAKVTIVEFADLRCPFCKQFQDSTFSQLKKDYIDTGKVKFAFRHYAFLGPASVTAANAVECANEQGQFWQMHDYLYQNQPAETDTSMYTTDNLTTIAGNLGMNTDQFKNCLSSTKYQKNVDQDMQDGQQAGVSGTPTFYINGTQLVGAQPYSSIKAVIDQALSKS